MEGSIWTDNFILQFKKGVTCPITGANEKKQAKFILTAFPHWIFMQLMPYFMSQLVRRVLSRTFCVFMSLALRPLRKGFYGYNSSHMAAIYPLDIKATCRQMHSSIFITGRASRFLFSSPQTADPLCLCCKAYANTSLRSKINMTSFNWQRYFLLPDVQCFLEINTSHCIIQCIVSGGENISIVLAC